MLSSLQRLLITGILLLSMVIGFFGYAQPAYQEATIQKVAGDLVMEFCVKGSNEALDQYAQKLQEKWESAVQEANLGYPITLLNLAQDPQAAQEQCDKAEEFLSQVDSGDNVELYKLVKEFQRANFTEAKKLQQQEFDDASSCLEGLIGLKAAEEHFSKNADSQVAKRYAQSSQWPYCAFFAQMALEQYGPLPTPSE